MSSIDFFFYNSKSKKVMKLFKCTNKNRMRSFANEECRLYNGISRVLVEITTILYIDDTVLYLIINDTAIVY